MRLWSQLSGRPEQIITALREAEVGKTVAMVSRELGISEQTWWRQEFGGMPKELEKENDHPSRHAPLDLRIEGWEVNSVSGGRRGWDP